MVDFRFWSGKSEDEKFMYSCQPSSLTPHFRETVFKMLICMCAQTMVSISALLQKKDGII